MAPRSTCAPLVKRLLGPQVRFLAVPLLVTGKEEYPANTVQLSPSGHIELETYERYTFSLFGCPTPQHEQQLENMLCAQQRTQILAFDMFV